MQKPDTDKAENAGKIDFARLLGFESVSEQLSNGSIFKTKPWTQSSAQGSARKRA